MEQPIDDAAQPSRYLVLFAVEIGIERFLPLQLAISNYCRLALLGLANRAREVVDLVLDEGRHPGHRDAEVGKTACPGEQAAPTPIGYARGSDAEVRPAGANGAGQSLLAAGPMQRLTHTLIHYSVGVLPAVKLAVQGLGPANYRWLAFLDSPRDVPLQAAAIEVFYFPYHYRNTAVRQLRDGGVHHGPTHFFADVGGHMDPHHAWYARDGV